MEIRHKTIKKDGFSIAELLVAILILGMVSTVVAGGIPVARDAYNKITVSANAQVLLSTSIAALRSQIGVASDVKADGNGLKYMSGKNGTTSKIYLSDKGEITIQEYVEYTGSTKVSPRPLNPGTDDLYVTYTKINPPNTNNVVIIEGLKVKKGTKEYAALDELDIRVMGN